jgi:hypothetical protein
LREFQLSKLKRAVIQRAKNRDKMEDGSKGQDRNQKCDCGQEIHMISWESPGLQRRTGCDPGHDHQDRMGKMCAIRVISVSSVVAFVCLFTVRALLLVEVLHLIADKNSIVLSRASTSKQNDSSNSFITMVYRPSPLLWHPRLVTF